MPKRQSTDECGPRGKEDVTKPYEFIGFGAMDVTKPYEFIGFGAMDVTKPYKLLRNSASGQEIGLQGSL